MVPFHLRLDHATDETFLTLCPESGDGGPAFRRRRVTWLLAVAVTLSLFFWGALSTVRAQPDTALLIAPAEAEIPADGTLTVTVEVRDVEDLYALELDVLFDPLLVQVERIEPGSFLSDDFVAEQEVDGENGRASLAYTQLPPGEPRSGSGTVAVLVLQAAGCSGQSSLVLTDTLLSDVNGMTLDHTTANGVVSSDVAAGEGRLSGSIYHDLDNDGSPDSGEPFLSGWPLYLQAAPPEPDDPILLDFSTGDGAFSFDAVQCGYYQLWSRNGESRVLTRTVTISPSSDVALDPLPVTGTLRYPLPRIFLPALHNEG